MKRQFILTMLATFLLAGCAAYQAPEPVVPGMLVELPAQIKAMDDAQFTAWIEAERGAIAAGRAAAARRWQEDELACWRRFAVNDCLHKARVQRRASLQPLRARELELNAMTRQRRTDQRLRAIEQKNPSE